MSHVLAHFTAVETPTGVLLFLAGFALGILVPKLAARLRLR